MFYGEDEKTAPEYSSAAFAKFTGYTVNRDCCARLAAPMLEYHGNIWLAR